MTRRAYDFSDAKKQDVKEAFNTCCAACGNADSRALTVDHWIAGDANDAGVCLCQYCNTTIKGNIPAPEKFRLVSRQPLAQDAAYLGKMHENQDAFQAWINQFRFFREGFKYNLKKIQPLKTPY